MKQKLLLVSAALLMAGSAMAERTKPVLTPMDAPVAESLETATAFYLYNAQFGGFVLGANDYTTRLSIGGKGDSLKVVQFDEGVGFYDYGKNKGYWSPDGWDDIWNDNGRDGYNKWSLTVKDEATKTYTLSNAKFGEGNLGYLSTDATPYPKLCIYTAEHTPQADTVVYDGFQFISVNDYKVMEAYKESLVLDKAIKDAKTQFATLDLAEEQAVCDNDTTTTEDIKKAEESVSNKLQAAAAAAATSNASVQNPVNMTEFIVNPSFEEGNTNGWTVKDSKDTGAKENSNGTYHCENADGNYLFNIWDTGYPISQVIKNLPNGIYEMSAMVSSSDDCTNIYILAGDGYKAVTLQKGEDGRKQTYMTTGTSTVRVENGSLKIGAVGCAADGVSYTENGKWWYKVDNFQLKFFGDKDDAYAYWRENGDDRIKIYDTKESQMTESVKEAYSTVVKEFNAATTKDAILAAYAKVLEQDSVVSANVAAWVALDAAVSSANSVANDKTIKNTEYKEELGEYVNDYEDVKAEAELTTEEIYKEIEKLEKLKTDAVENGISDGSDMTKYLANPNFNNGTQGWLGDVTVNASCGEKYGSKEFDVYQDVKISVVGIYEITMQGFYRESRDDAAATDTVGKDISSLTAGAAWTLYHDENGNLKTGADAPSPLAYVYMNNNKTPLKSLYEEKIKVGEVFIQTNDKGETSNIGDARVDPYGEYWYANTMATAAAAFGKDLYRVSSFGLVSKKGETIRIGVKGDLKGGANWAIFDNFKLIYREFNATVMDTILTQLLREMDLTQTMGTDVKAEAVKAKESAEAVDRTNGEEMFQVVVAINEVSSKIETSTKLFQQLSERKTKFETEIETYSSDASESAQKKAVDLMADVKSKLTNGCTDAEAQQALSDIEEAVTALLMPVDYASASDDEPCDFTNVIRCADFTDADGNNSVEGWTYDVMPGGITSGQKDAKAAEYYEKTFNIYQVLHGMPEGTYQLSVNACYRKGNSQAGYEAFAKGEETLARMYATTSCGSVSKNVCHMSEFAQDAKIGSGSEAEITINEDGDKKYQPNDMISCVAYFSEGLYNNSIIFKVGKDGFIRFGMIQKESVGAGWLLMDDWTLKYFGPNSSQEVAISTLNEDKVIKVIRYNVNGQRINGLQKGMNILHQIDANGNVKTIKMFVK